MLGYAFSPEPADTPVEGRSLARGHLVTERTETDKRAEMLQRRIETLEEELKAERRDSESLKKQKRRLKRRVRSLERQIQAIRTSRTWEAVSTLRRIKPSVSRKR